MKTLKAICTMAILALALTVPASAGEMLTPGFIPPPPPPPPVEEIKVAVAPPTSSELGDLTATEIDALLWVLASIF